MSDTTTEGQPQRPRMFVSDADVLVTRAFQRPAGFRPLVWHAVSTVLAGALWAALAGMLLWAGLLDGHMLDAFAVWWVLAGVAVAVVLKHLDYAASLGARVRRYRRDIHRTALASMLIPPAKELELGGNGRFIREHGCGSGWGVAGDGQAPGRSVAAGDAGRRGR